MNRLRGKHILLGITGGIAAYKSADLCSRLKKAGAQIQIVMTPAATKFVSALTFQALSGNPVHHTLLDETAEAGMSHIELARWADAILIVPASANTLAKLAHGRADNLLTTLCLASEAIKCFAPAMNRVMWADPATAENCRILLDNGWYQFGPDNGIQACGETGEGRMQETDALLSNLNQCFTSGLLQGLNVIVTAGPTQEAIDPVRYITNRSSGRMGYAMAAAAHEAGAQVTLISGPTSLTPPPVDTLIQIESAEEMLQAVMQNIHDTDIYISTAAVADYRVAQKSTQKIKKHSDQLTLTLVKNPDILTQVARLQPRPVVIGFAAETEHLQQHAIDKLQRKNLDMIIANDVGTSSTGNPPTGFNSQYNRVHLFQQHNGEITQHYFDTTRKTQLARKLIAQISQYYQQHRNKQISHSV